MTRQLFTMAEMSQLTDAMLLKGTKPAAMGGFCIDSRKAGETLLFAPLRGENTDGHRYLEQAVSGGCNAFMCSKTFYSANKEFVERLAALCAGALLVDDVLKAMQKIAAGHVARFPYLKKIGITGSNGKTTTRRLVAAVLDSSAKTVQTRGNLNSEIGLPMSVLDITPDDVYAVFEMGINHPGEMKDLAAVFGPDYGVYTNIGTAHIGLLGSRDEIAAEKRNMMSAAANRPVVFIHEAEKYAEFLSAGAEVCFFGPKNQNISDCRNLGLDGFEFNWNDCKVKLALAGKHNLSNALAALAIAEYFNIDSAKAAEALSKVKPMFGRAEILKGDFTLIQDCYNANPESMLAALDFVQDLEVAGKKIVVLGEMKELGEAGPDAHASIASNAAARKMSSGSAKIDTLYFFGELFSDAVGSPGHADSEIFNDIEALAETLSAVLGKGDLLFLKGSRGVALERITEKLKGRYSLC